MNSAETYGDDGLFRALVQNQLTEFEDNRITNVGQYGFNRRTGLEEIRLPSCVRVRQYGFYICPDLQTVDIGDICLFDSACITDCKNLRNIIFRSTQGVSCINIWYFEANALKGVHGAIYVPRSMLSEYRQRWSGDWQFISGELRTNASATPSLIGHLQPLEDYPVSDFSTIPLTWTQIKAAVEDGSFFTSGYLVGDLKKLEYGNKTVYMQLARIDAENHYIEFITRNFAETVAMHSSSSVLVPYSETAHKARLDAIYNSELPSDLKAVITPVTKRYGSTNQAGYEDVTLNLWTPSLREFSGPSSSAANETGTRYSIFGGIGSLKFISADPTLSAYTESSYWVPTSRLSSGNSAYYDSSSSVSSVLTTEKALIFGFRIAKTSV